ncbi:MAG TPA: AgmX/PglI C-terminal domain-containing protein, partial [Polyangiaceae bacterium]
GRPDGGEWAQGSRTQPPAERTQVVSELPYKIGERPRADGAVVASVDDEAIARSSIGGSSNPACPSNRPGFHPAPRVKVDTNVVRGQLPARSAAKGVLSELGVLAQTRSRGYWPFRLCFEAGLKRNGALAGKSQLRMVIGMNGRVARSRLESTELRDAEVSTCLVTQAHALRFTPVPRRRFEVDLTVDLNPGDAPLPDAAPLVRPGRPEPPQETCPGRIDDRAAMSALEPLIPRITECYAAGRARDPLLWGRVALRLDATETGKIDRVAEHDTRFPAPAVVRCIAASVMGAVVPLTEGGRVRFVWGLRLGAPPLLESAGNVLPLPPGKTSVADPPSPRVRLGP